MRNRAFDIRLTSGEAVVLLELARRLDEDPTLTAQLTPAEHVVVTNLIDVLSDALYTGTAN
ncbi:MAG TPA: hypothetical protein VF183_09600 [Acidimicrobiales bacterium]